MSTESLFRHFLALVFTFVCAAVRHWRGTQALVTGAGPTGSVPAGDPQGVTVPPDTQTRGGGVARGANTSGDWITFTVTAAWDVLTRQCGDSGSTLLQQIANDILRSSLLFGSRVSDTATSGATDAMASGLPQPIIPRRYALPGKVLIGNEPAGLRNLQ